MIEIRMEYPIRHFVPLEGYAEHLMGRSNFWNEHKKAIGSGEAAYNSHREAVRENLFVIYHAVATTGIATGIIGLIEALR